MSDGFFYIRDTQTGGRFRCLARPYMRGNSPYEEMTKEEFYGTPALPEKNPAPTDDNEDLMAGLDDGENGQ